MSDYPRMMYRDGGIDEIWGCPVESRVVLSSDEETEAAGEGWRREVIAPANPFAAPVLADQPKRRGRPPKALALAAPIE